MSSDLTLAKWYVSKALPKTDKERIAELEARIKELEDKQ